MRATAIVADDHQIVRQGLVPLLEGFDLKVIAEASNGLQAISLCKAYQPQLLMLDVAMPLAGALEVFEEVRRWSPDTRVVVLTGVSTNSILNSLILAGVHGIALKDSPATELKRVVTEVLAGGNCVDSAVEAMVAEAATTQLTKRETQVLGFLVRGYGNGAIAEALGVSPATVNNHRANIMRKVGVHSIAELMAYALREGLLDGLKDTRDPPEQP